MSDKWTKCSERLPLINQDESGNNPHLHEYMQSERVLAWLENPDIYDYHDEGGLVVVAEDLELALVLVTKETEGRVTELPPPDATYDLSRIAPDKVFIFPNAGCC